MINRQAEVRLQELAPYSNRVGGGGAVMDPRAYLSQEQLGMSQSSVPTEDLNRTNVNSREHSYIKKYKKAKKQLKLLLKEKRESESRTSQILNDNNLL